MEKAKVAKPARMVDFSVQMADRVPRGSMFFSVDKLMEAGIDVVQTPLGLAFVPTRHSEHAHEVINDACNALDLYDDEDKERIFRAFHSTMLRKAIREAGELID